MPTSVSSKGYEGGRHPARSKVRPKKTKTVATVHPDGHVTATGPEAHVAKKEAEASVKRVKKVVKKTKTAEHTKAVAKSLKPGFESGPEFQREQAKKRRTERFLKDTLGSTVEKPSAPKVPTATERNPENKEGYTPDEKALIARNPLGDLQKLEEEGKIGKTTGQEIYQKIAEYGPLAVDIGLVGANVLKGAAVKAAGAQVGEDVIGGSSLARKLGLKAVEAGADSTKVAKVAAQKADQQIAKDAAASGVRAAAKKLVRSKAAKKLDAELAETLGTTPAKVGSKLLRRKAERKAEQALAYDVTGTQAPKAALRASTPVGATFKGGAAQTTAVVQGHEKAIVENPLKVASTTAKALPGFITVPIGIAANTGLSVGRAASEAAHVAGIPGAAGYSGEEILAPIKYEGQSQLEFAKQVAKVLTSSDPKYVQKEVEDSLGLLLPITLGLTGKATLDHLGKGDRSAAEAIMQKVRTVVEDVRQGRGEGHGPDAKVLQNQSLHHSEAVAAARTKRGIKAEAHDRSHEIVANARRMSEKEKLRAGQTRDRLGRRRSINVRPSDLGPLILRSGWDLSHPKEVLKLAKAENRRIAKAREKAGLSKRIDETGDLSTQDLLETIEKHPDWLEKPELKAQVDAMRTQERFAVENGLSPDHSEPARVSSVAVQHGLPQTHERFPASVKDVVRAQEKSGIDPVAILKKEAKEDGSAAKKAKRKAQKADHATAGELRKEAARLTEEARLKSEAARNYAKTLDERTSATLAAVNDHIAQTPGLHPQGPEYVNTGKPKIAPGIAGGGAPLHEASKIGNSKFKSGKAEQLGLSAEGLGNYLENSIGAPVARRHIFANVRRFLDQHKQNKDHPVTSAEARAIFDDPKSHINRKNFVLMDTQLTDRAYKFINEDPRFTKIDPADEHFFEKLADRSEWIADVNAAKAGRKYNIVPRAAAEEFLAQMSRARTSRLLAGLNKWSNFLILNTSPAWAITQFGAEFAQAAMAEPRLLNPVKLRAYIKAYHEMDPVKRREFETWADATTRSIGSQKDIDLALHTGKDASGAAKAFGVMNRTKLGRILRGVPTSLRAVDEWKGGRIRVLTALAKQDRELNGHLNGFLKGAGNLYRTESDIAKQLAGKSHKEVAEFWASHPKGAERYGKYLDEVMGNWSALTQNERVASQLLIFYPFMRMSLKWTFYSFPKEHPIRAAMSQWLGTQNAQQLEELLGGKVGFFSEWANAPLYSGSGKTPNEAAGFVIPLSRLSVAGNAFTEALGGSLTEKNQGPPGAKVAESVVQPAIGATLTGLTGLNKFTGKQEAHSGKQLLEQAEALSPISRTAKKFLKSKEEQTALTELFEKLKGSLPEQMIRSNVFPELPIEVDLQRDLVSLDKALEVMSSSGTDAHDALKNRYREEGKTGAETYAAEQKLWNEYDKGKATLEKLYRKYGISKKATKENKEYESFEDERKYGGHEQTSILGKIEESVGLSGHKDTLTHIEEEVGLAGEGTLEKIEKEVGLR